MADRIIIDGLELSSFIGVPDEERAAAQRLTVNMSWSRSAVSPISATPSKTPSIISASARR